LTLSSPALAFKQLKNQPGRLVVALAGVAFAVILMLMQLGFSTALYQSAVRLHERLIADIVLVSPLSQNIAGMRAFPRPRLYSVLGVPGVASVTPAYCGFAGFKNLDTGRSRDIFVLGVDPRTSVIALPDVERGRASLQMQDTVLYDARSRPEYGNVRERVERGERVDVEIANRRVSVAGLFEIGTSFAIDGLVLTSDLNFLRIFKDHSPGMIELGLVRLRPGADRARVQRAVAETLPDDVSVLSHGEYVKREVDYWAEVTPIGFIFTFGSIMGFVVGAVIVYQILFADVSDHLAEYATLKAIGHGDGFLATVVLSQAVLLAVLGFVPGALAAQGLYGVTEKATELPMQMRAMQALAVLGLTVLMCALAALLALRRLRSADPAEIF
jgi:putative ABC transport system permease protein